MNWEDLDAGSKLCVVLVLVCLVVTIAGHLLADAPADGLTQREVVLGDGTKATCIIVRDAGVTCVPHVVLGSDAEDDTP
jgi:hypothetical protein